MNIVLIETSGNQRYIFGTNKLRENVGASELIHRLGARCVLQEVKTHTGRTIWEEDDPDGGKLRKNLLDPEKNPPVGNGNKVEVVVATSGKAILLVDGEDTGKVIIGNITLGALRDMPGLTVHGAICEVNNDLSDIHSAIQNVHRRLEETIRYALPTTEQRFLRLPFAAPCDTSGLPACGVRTYHPSQNSEGARAEVVVFSRIAQAKRESLIDPKTSGEEKDSFTKSRIVTLLEKVSGAVLFSDLDKLEKQFKDELEWIAVVHADGNGIGEIFMNFKEACKKEKREYLDAYRRFSIALDVCTMNAAGKALQNLKRYFPDSSVPVVPLVLGGDDFTFLCDGKFALKFTCDFLNEFERQTGKDDCVSKIAGQYFGATHLGICAGVAIAKPHYPFHQAYDLAEQLLRSAKQVKTKIRRANGKHDPCAAFDFHILYDSGQSDLEDIRDVKLTVSRANQPAAHLYAKPYVVSELNDQKENTWLRYRRFAELKKRIDAIRKEDDDGGKLLPNGKLHEIRMALFRGKESVDAETRLIGNRLKGGKTEFDDLPADGHSVFFSDEDGFSTHFLDALEAANEFWEGFETTEEPQLSESEVKQ